MVWGKACQVIHTSHWHSKESDCTMCFWLSSSEQFELFVLTCPIMELCTNVQFHFRLGFLSVETGRIVQVNYSISPWVAYILNSLVFTFFIGSPVPYITNKHLSMVMIASLYSSCPIVVVRNVTHIFFP